MKGSSLPNSKIPCERETPCKRMLAAGIKRMLAANQATSDGKNENKCWLLAFLFVGGSRECLAMLQQLHA